MTTFEKLVTDRYECPCCKTSMPNFISRIKIHNATKKHLTNSGLMPAEKPIDIQAEYAAIHNSKIRAKIYNKRTKLNDELIELLTKNKETISTEMMKYVLLKLSIPLSEHLDLVEKPEPTKLEVLEPTELSLLELSLQAML